MGVFDLKIFYIAVKYTHFFMKNLYLLLVLFLFNTSLIAQNAEGNITRSINDQGVNGITVNYSLNDFSISQKQIKNEIFHQLYIEKFSFLHNEGQPSLPAHRDLILIPEGTKAKLQIQSFDVDTIKNINIIPAQPPKTDEEIEDKDTPESFIIDSVLYKKDTYYPAKLVKINQQQKIRNSRIGILRITPFRFNPVKKQLLVYRNIKYKLTYPTATHYFEDISKHSKGYLQTLPEKFLNKATIKKEIRSFKTSKNLSPDYLIITHPDFSMAADTLAKKKQQLGYHVRIIKKNNWTSTGVKDSIHAAYYNSGNYPDYFVILGDHQYIPAELVDTAHNRYSDLYYACMDSLSGTTDYYPDMAHGRISVSSSSEALQVVDKISQYTFNPPSSASFYNSGLNCAYFQDDDTSGFASRRFVHTSEEIRDYLINQSYNVNRVYFTHGYITPTNYNNGYYSDGQSLPSDLLKSNGYAWDGDGNDVVNEINSGRFYVLHRDHGFANGWGDPHFTSSHIPSLNNQNELPVVFSINCSSGNFIKDNCFSEKLLRKANGGAVGVISASNTSYSGFNDGFSAGLFDAIWAAPGLIPDFGSGGISNPVLPPHSDIRNMGHVLNHGLFRMVETWGDSRTTHELMHYHGDPAMRIHTSQPVAITATVQDTLNCDSTTLQILSCSVSDATATLVHNGQILDKIQLTNGAGTLNFAPIDNIMPYASLTISKDNHIPFTTKIPVLGCINSPVAKFYVNDTVLSCFNNSVSFYDISNYHPSSRQWHFNPPTVNYLNGNAQTSSVNVQFTDTGYYDVKLVTSNAYGSDSIISANKIYVYPAQPTPFAETVESLNNFGNEDSVWTTYSNLTYAWYIHNDSTPSFSTGPITDHTLGNDQGHFFYTEASTGSKGDTTMLISPVLYIKNLSTPALKFWYHMFGADINVLHIEVSTGNSWQLLKSIHGQQQTAYTDSWKKALIDLSNYSSNCIKIRFTAIRGPGYKGDIALDDIEIIDYTIPPQVAFNSSAKYACSGHTVRFEDLSCCGTNQREWYFPGGNPQYSTDTSPVITYDSTGIFNVSLKATNAYGSDSIVKYAHVITDQNQSLPVSENFEAFYPGNPGTFYNDWHADKTHDFEWRVNNGNTPSSGTGPVYDHTYGNSSGVYVYTEASYVSEGEEAFLYTPCISVPNAPNSFLRFWAHMYGSGIDTIHIDVYDGTQYLNDIYTIGGAQQQSPLDNWKKFQTDISYLAGKDVRFRFRSKRTGSYTDDKAIDDFIVFNGGFKIIPDTIDFGNLYALQRVYDSIRMTNNSPDSIQLLNMIFPQGFYPEDSLIEKLAPGDTSTLTFSFLPGQAGDFNGYVNIYSELNADSVYVSGTFISSVDEATHNVVVNIYPNPFDNSINLEINNVASDSDFELTVYNSKGQQIEFPETTIRKNKPIKLNLQSLSQGVYFLKIINREHTIMKKIIKQ